MTDLRKAAETKLFRLLGDENHDIQLRAAIALLQTPAQPEQEPVAWMYEWNGTTHFTTTDQSFVEKAHPHFAKSTPLYTAPPKREWVGLTDEDLEPMCDDWRIIFGPYVHDFTKAIEAKLKEKNT